LRLYFAVNSLYTDPTVLIQRCSLASPTQLSPHFHKIIFWARTDRWYKSLKPNHQIVEFGA